MGRKATPTRLKVISGTDQKCRVNSDEPQYQTDGITIPHEWLTEDEQGYWAHFAPRLINSKVMTQADIVSLVQLCKETALYFKACKMIENLGAAGEVYLTPTGTWARNPWLMIRKQAFESSGKRMAEFGLNPADRTRVGIAKAEKSPGGKYGGLRD